MIIRIWRTQVDPSRMAEYEHFEQTYSLPMFHQQNGCLGVLFLCTEKDCAALSLWENEQAIEQLATSPTYQATVRQLQSTGLLRGEQSVEVFEIQGGDLEMQAIGILLRGKRK